MGSYAEDLIRDFEKYMADENYEKALPKIKEIIRLSPGIRTSWFNYGECLFCLGRMGESGGAFLKAYNLDPNDTGALYRACVSLAKANDTTRLLGVFRHICRQSPGMIHKLTSDDLFKPFFELPEFKELGKSI